MRTHNIGSYEDLTKIIFQLSSKRTVSLLLDTGVFLNDMFGVHRTWQVINESQKNGQFNIKTIEIEEMNICLSNTGESAVCGVTEE